MNFHVYSDGSATVASKPGGYGFVIVQDDIKIAEGCGHSEKATNNDMELLGAIQGLAHTLKYVTDKSIDKYSVTLISDSQLVLGWASGRYKFKQYDKMSQYKQLMFLMNRLKAKTEWVKGHSGNEFNEQCDKLANQARLGITKQIEEPLREGTSIGSKRKGVIGIWYQGVLKLVDLSSNVVENYDRILHGQRGSMLEIREDKSR